MTVTDMPALNAALNGLAGIFLFQGWRAIKAGDRQRHKRWMLSALACSVLFLISYLTYHALKEGVVTHYQGVGLKRFIYFFILITHTPLATAVVPLSLSAIYMAYRGRFQTHVKITRWLYPIWIYVSITGVLIYLMLYVLPM